MPKIVPIFATESTAAKLLDLSIKAFRALVADGYLPAGQQIAPGIFRWRVDELKRIASGESVEGLGDVDW
ncbi:hypothetical protein [Salipiger abyssi]|uniref:hypothetical protein n=1 Tax=Salipiger abyssi TaxID=1250539 RepID=UPI0009784E4B|nr:hypothetical protein [Salipiger abyssi]